MVGSTDVGDVSWAVPTVQMRGATYAIGTPGHSWQLTAQGKTPARSQGDGACGQGNGRDRRRRAARWGAARAGEGGASARLARTPYVSPLPEGLAPVWTWRPAPETCS